MEGEGVFQGTQLPYVRPKGLKLFLVRETHVRVMSRMRIKYCRWWDGPMVDFLRLRTQLKFCKTCTICCRLTLRLSLEWSCRSRLSRYPRMGSP